MKVIADKNGLPWNFYTYYGINTAYVLAQAIKAAGTNLTRAGLINALQTKASTFRSAAIVPLVVQRPYAPGSPGVLHGPVQRLGPVGPPDALRHHRHQRPDRRGQEDDVPATGPTPKLLP